MIDRIGTKVEISPFFLKIKKCQRQSNFIFVTYNLIKGFFFALCVSFGIIRNSVHLYCFQQLGNHSHEASVCICICIWMYCLLCVLPLIFFYWKLIFGWLEWAEFGLNSKWQKLVDRNKTTSIFFQVRMVQIDEIISHNQIAGKYARGKIISFFFRFVLQFRWCSDVDAISFFFRFFRFSRVQPTVVWIKLFFRILLQIRTWRRRDMHWLDTGLKIIFDRISAWSGHAEVDFGCFFRNIVKYWNLDGGFAFFSLVEY